eukprot:CAMPEP_0174756064 /NCGR_PEP_ID=MMETSP1094-20130205/106569_1 /TAXON_ID=156173 /ORGANISM="Chrysochromulina brevifilum, Strain UTEX LB 985" /LENGTH=132 /DNA_ID=CAMNT_0015961969 /DNA_START=251 /DNA_END=649 /DNA_ORIENTATION=+
MKERRADANRQRSSEATRSTSDSSPQRAPTASRVDKGVEKNDLQERVTAARRRGSQRAAMRQCVRRASRESTPTKGRTRISKMPSPQQSSPSLDKQAVKEEEVAHRLMIERRLTIQRVLRKAVAQRRRESGR